MQCVQFVLGTNYACLPNEVFQFCSCSSHGAKDASMYDSIKGSLQSVAGG